MGWEGMRIKQSCVDSDLPGRVDTLWLAMETCVSAARTLNLYLSLMLWLNTLCGMLAVEVSCVVNARVEIPPGEQTRWDLMGLCWIPCGRLFCEGMHQPHALCKELLAGARAVYCLLPVL
jgi:hypothetical protein